MKLRDGLKEIIEEAERIFLSAIQGVEDDPADDLDRQIEELVEEITWALEFQL